MIKFIICLFFSLFASWVLLRFVPSFATHSMGAHGFSFNYGVLCFFLFLGLSCKVVFGE